MKKFIKSTARIIFIIILVAIVLNLPSLLKNYVHYKEDEPTLKELLTEAGVSDSVVENIGSSPLDEIEQSTGMKLTLDDETDYETVTLIRVVDGDTICVDKGTGSETKVRLIGCNTPESVHPDEEKNTEEGTQASNYTKKLLTEGMELYLTYDVEKSDDYGRTLAYVWINPPSGNENTEEVRDNMVNGILISRGFAEPMVVEPNVKYKETFDELYNSR